MSSGLLPGGFECFQVVPQVSPPTGVLQAVAFDFRNTVPVRTTEAGSRAPTLPAALETQIPRTGDVLDSKFRITGVLGSGGMGCVYLAEHLSLRRPVALKLLHPQVEGIEEVSLRFEREAFATGRVDHPNCVNVSDFGRLEDGTLYMVLEVLDGVSLFDLIEKEGRIEWRRALHIGRHVLCALACAHSEGIVHRDVKPENVILVHEDDDPDFAKILDFGIAKLFDGANLPSDDPRLTQLGVTIGTPTYIAPEQAFGQPIDARADLYALSVMLYEMIVGVPPFEAEEVVALLSMHTAAEVPPFRKAAPEARVPKSVETLIRDGLEKNRDDRVPTAGEYIARIDEILEADASSFSVDAESGLREIPSLMVEGFRDTVAPAMARAVTRRKTPMQILATTATVLALMALMVFAFGSKGPDYLPTRNHLPLVAPKHGPEAEAAAEILEQGRPNEAAAYLIERKKDVREEPYAQMVLGHAHASAQRSILALVAYEDAVLLEPKLANDELMRTNLDLMLDKKAPGVVDDALDFMGMLVREVDDGDAADRLVALASSDEAIRTRQHAVAVADEVGLGDRIDRLASYLLDLEQGQTCLARKDAVAKLRALGDKKAIPTLEVAQKRIRTEGLMKKKVNTNACLRTDAAEAILYLQSL
jgi:serine/threonine protein kinase